jgi:hypothetical protein
MTSKTSQDLGCFGKCEFELRLLSYVVVSYKDDDIPPLNRDWNRMITLSLVETSFGYLLDRLGL